jgi:hypothetical protein
MPRLSPADRFEILDLIHRYNWLADVRDVAATLTEYTADGAITGDFAAGPGARFADDLARVFAGEGTLKRHVACNVRFAAPDPNAPDAPDAPAVTATADYVLLVLEAGGPPAVGATSVVRDEFRRVDGRWKVRRHHVHIDPGLRDLLVAGGMLPAEAPDRADDRA